VGAIGRIVDRPLKPAFQQLGHGARPRAPVLAGADLFQQPGLGLFGLAHRGLGLAGNLLAHPPLAAGERITACVDLDLEAVTALADHGCFPCWSCSF
jgi:hypothetical protein